MLNKPLSPPATIKLDTSKNGLAKTEAPLMILMVPTCSTINKCFKSYRNSETVLSQNPMVGYYTDTTEPYYLIGLNENDLIKQEIILKHIYKVFYKHIKFNFINLNDTSMILKWEELREYAKQ